MIGFGAVYYCPVHPKPSERAGLSAEDVERAAAIQDRGVALHGRDVSSLSSCSRVWAPPMLAFFGNVSACPDNHRRGVLGGPGKLKKGRGRARSVLLTPCRAIIVAHRRERLMPLGGARCIQACHSDKARLNRRSQATRCSEARGLRTWQRVAALLPCPNWRGACARPWQRMELHGAPPVALRFLCPPYCVFLPCSRAALSWCCSSELCGAAVVSGVHTRARPSPSKGKSSRATPKRRASQKLFECV